MEWAGTDTESFALVNAINRQCQDQASGGQHCAFDATGARTYTCAAHRVLLKEQKALDGLLFWRRNADRLKEQEHTEEGST